MLSIRIAIKNNTSHHKNILIHNNSKMLNTHFQTVYNLSQLMNMFWISTKSKLKKIKIKHQSNYKLANKNSYKLIHPR